MEIIVGCVIGIVLGLTGAGGSVFAVPLLVIFLDLPMTQAAGLSLGAVSASAILGVLMKLRSGDVQWLPAIVFACLGSLATPLGAWLGRLLNDMFLLVSFGVLVFIIAYRMWRQASESPEEARVVRAGKSVAQASSGAVCAMNQNREFKIGLPCVMGLSGGALSTGLLSGLFGVGGGFLIVPVLLRLTQISMQQAVASSLVVISIVGSVGFANFVWVNNSIDELTLVKLIFGGLAGMSVGIFVSQFIAGPNLQKGFAVLMVIIFIVTLLTKIVGL